MRAAVRLLGQRQVSWSCRPLVTSSVTGNHVIRSDSPHVVIPDVSVFEYVWQHRHKYTNRRAFICGVTDRSLTYEETYTQSLRFSSGLRMRGYKRRDVIAAFLPNCIEFPVYLHGCAAAGIVASPINPIATEDEIVFYLQLSGAVAVVTCAALAPVVQLAAARVQHVREVICTDGGPSDCVPFEEVVRRGGSEGTLVEVDLDADDMMLLFSSGTTGLPKAAALNNRSLLANLLQCLQHPFLWERNDNERFIGILPLFHVFGIHVYMLKGPCLGAENMLLPCFKPASMIAALRKHKPTSLHVVPPLLNFLTSEAVSVEDLKSLQMALCAAAPIGPALISQFQHKTNNRILFAEGYGMTEASPVLTICPTDAPHVMGSCGKLMANTELQVVSVEDGRGLSTGETGELWFRGPQVMKGYHGNSEATRQTIDSDGWLHTGDVGHYDTDGNVFISDRIKELIKYKGAQVAPAMLEDLLRQHEAVVDAAVVGVAHPVDGERARGFVQLRPDSDVTPEQLQDFVAARINKSEQLHGGVRVVSQIPRSAAGKILRRVLRDQIRDEMKDE